MLHFLWNASDLWWAPQKMTNSQTRYSTKLSFLCKELLILAYQLYGLPQFVNQASFLSLLFFHLMGNGGQKGTQHVALVHVGSVSVHQTNHYEG